MEIIVFNSFSLSWCIKLYVFKQLLQYLTATDNGVIGGQELNGITQSSDGLPLY